jgi:hypothetical protein
MAEWEKKVLDLLTKICNNTAPSEIVEAIATDIGSEVTKKISSSFTRQDKGFNLRMSGIGRDLRQQLLQKKYGREEMTPGFLMRVTYGHLYEAVFVTLLKHAGVKFSQAEKVTLVVDENISIPGELDIIFDIDGLIWDVKTASPNAFQYKFVDWSTLEAKDDFGYFGQLFGYSEAAGIPAGGWIVIDKSSGMWKVVEIPQHEHKRLREKYVADIKAKAKHITYSPDDIPPCPGIEEESFNGKLTGKKILGKVCEYCPYKDGICHTKITRKPCEHSKAKTTVWKNYIEG